MRQDYLTVTENATVAEAIEGLENQSCYAHFYTVYVITPESGLLGEVDVKDLLRASAERRVGELYVPSAATVLPETDQEEVAEIVSRNNLVEVPVVDAGGRILGVISVDDVVDVLIQEATEDIFRAQGVEQSPPAGTSLIGLSVLQHFRARMPWLLLSLAGGLIAGVIIDVFEARVETLILTLVVFVPFVMALGGNVGSQSATILVRELALDAVRDTRRYFLKETAIGLSIGVMIGLVVGLLAWLWQGSTVVGWVVGLASLAVSLAGVLIGTFVPWFFYRIGVDTALGSGPIVTTLKDITGLLIYFSIALLVIRAAGL